jgi:hypothetical protein
MQYAPDPIYEIGSVMRVSIEVFYSDRMLETFGEGGPGWFTGRADAAVRQTARRPVRSLRATQGIGTR